MPPPQECNQLRAELSALEALKAEFDTAYEEAVRTGNLERVKKLKLELQQSIATLKEKLNPLERILGLKEQYQQQRDILEKTGVLEQLSSGELGIKGIDGTEYPLPSYREIAQKFREKKELLKTKTKQGFTKLVLVPFGMKLEDLIQKYKQTLVKHFQEGKLFFTKKDANDPNEALVPITADMFNANEPVWVWDGYQEADTTGKLIYFPKEFSANHQGSTKKEFLEQRQQGWEVILLEDMPNIPKEGEGKTHGGRTQLDTKGSSIKPFIASGTTTPSPKEYLKALQEDPQYQHEQGLLPEDWLIYALTMLEEQNQIIDDYSGNGKVSYNLGAYFPTSDGVPRAYWSRDYRQTRVYRNDVDRRYDDCGVRPSVRVWP